ncbi:MAG: AAA family ATPase [Gaiellales bacterium]
MANTRLSIATHHGFPSELLDRAIPNGNSGLLVASGMTDFSRALMAAERDNSEVMLLFTPTVSEVVDVLSASRSSRPDMGLVVAMPGPGNGSLAEALRAGADEIVLLPAEAPVVTAAVQKALARVSAAHGPEGAGAPAEATPLIVVLGPKGGVGKTTVSTNLATELARRGRRTLLIDLDLQFGDCGVALGITPERTIYDLVSAPGRLDGERLGGFLARSSDGVHVLLAPVRPDQADAVTSERLDEILHVAHAEFDAIVVDTPLAFTATTIAAIDRAHHTVMVGTLDLAGLKNAKVGAETLAMMGFPAERVTTVLNRGDSKVGLMAADVAKVLSREPDSTVPSDRAVPRSLNSARPIVVSDPRSGPAKALRKLADRVEAAVFQTVKE